MPNSLSAKVFAVGPEGLSDEELLDVLLDDGRVKRMALTGAFDFRTDFSDSRVVAKLRRRYGWRKPMIARFLALSEWVKRRAREADRAPAASIRTPGDAWSHVRPYLFGEKTESFFVLLVDACNAPIHVEKVSSGSSEAVFLSMKDAFASAVLWKASGIFCFHNHPSQDPTPSPADVRLTRAIGRTAKTLGLRFLDHIVCCDRQAYSMAAQQRVLG